MVFELSFIHTADVETYAVDLGSDLVDDYVIVFFSVLDIGFDFLGSYAG